MKMIHQYIIDKRQNHPLHFTLLDPGKMNPDDLVGLAKQTAEAGTDGFLIGGSTDLSLEKVDASVDAIKDITFTSRFISNSRFLSFRSRRCDFFHVSSK